MTTASASGTARIAIATGNKNKIAEFDKLLKGLKIEMYQGAKLTFPPEDGIDYHANAAIKARHGAKNWGVLCVGEDSGIEVVGLNNLPGPFSARFGQFSDAQIEEGRRRLTLYGINPANAQQGNSNDTENNERLLRLLKGKTGDARHARYVASVVVADPSGEILFSNTATVGGRLLEAPRGTGGFGYDPIMEFYQYPGQSVSEIDVDAKNRISHRGKAMMALLDWLAHTYR